MTKICSLKLTTGLISITQIPINKLKFPVIYHPRQSTLGQLTWLLNSLSHKKFITLWEPIHIPHITKNSITLTSNIWRHKLMCNINLVPILLLTNQWYHLIPTNLKARKKARKAIHLKNISKAICLLTREPKNIKAVHTKFIHNIVVLSHTIQQKTILNSIRQFL